MAHNGRKYLTQKRNASYVTILLPGVKRGTPPRQLTKADYVDVPRLSTIGTYSLMDMLSDDSIRNSIEVYNRLKQRA